MRNHSVRHFRGFTLVELIVVITILAILATIGFLALSGYSQDAKDSAIKANVRSVQTAISSEAALTNNSPRYYVVHDTGAALSGAFVYVDGNQTALMGGDWNVSGTNYSAGNPDYAKLKMNPEKFKVSALDGILEKALAAYDSRYLTVGAMDALAGSTNGGKKRAVSYFQVAGISPASGSVTVSGNYPAASGSVAGLIKDPKSSSSTGALVE
ncbi:MAG: type II secretion system protein [Patescibacteria group bacterium]